MPTASPSQASARLGNQLRIVSSAPRPNNDHTARASVEIYRPFFIAGVACVLTAGCLLGALALLGVSMNASYTATAWTPYVLAHANSQLYGWVAFFVMGFSLQHHAPTVGKAALFHKLAIASMLMMVLGIGARFAAEPLSAVDREIWVPVGMAAGVAQALAVGLYFLNTTVTRYRTKAPITWQTAFVFASLLWLAIVAAVEPLWFVRSHAANPVEGILFVAKWFPPYREAQFLGFVVMMIFGVALVKMHSCFGAQEANRRLGMAGFSFWTVGLLLRMFGWVAAFGQNLTAESRLTYHAGGVLLAIGAVLLVASSRMFSKLEFDAPSQKFIRGAFAWLLLGGIMMAIEPVHLNLIGRQFSHAYIGAVRHALTVGFISQMIIGVGMHVVARMNDLPRQLERPLWATFWLLNVGNAGRVFLEIWTDYSKASFAPMGVTGFIELAGIAIWGTYMISTMLRFRRRALSTAR